MAKEMIEVRVLDNFGMRIYSHRVLTSDKKALAQVLYSILTKYGTSFKELNEIIEKDTENYYDYSNI